MISMIIPGSKSLANRALLAAALAKGKSKLTNVLESDDTRVMRRALHALLKKSSRPIFCGNSGTTLRFLAAVLATKSYPSILTGNSRMKKRPIKDLAEALRQLGARPSRSNDASTSCRLHRRLPSLTRPKGEILEFLGKKGFPPIRVRGPLRGGICRVKGNVSSQFLSGLLFAAPLAEKPVTISVQGDLVSKPYVDMTLDVMEHFGIRVKRDGYKKFFVEAPQQYRAKNFEIEGDASSASYFWAISAISGEPIKITNIPNNSKQADMRFLVSLRALQSRAKQSSSSESRLLRRSAPRNDTTMNCRDFPDSAMTLATLAAFRNDKTILTGLENLRVKECDRLHALATELRKIGARVKERRDGLEIIGRGANPSDGRRPWRAREKSPQAIDSPRIIKTYQDHRMAMCFGAAQFFIPGIKIENPSCVKKTYPDFWKDLASLKKKFLQKNIILTGMRGSGKSKLGAILGRTLGRKFVDIDELIEKRAKRPIAEFVARYGWKAFRKLEQKAVRSLRHIHHAIIATGGGTLMYAANANILKANGRVIFLECAVPSLQKRLARNMERPALLEKVASFGRINKGSRLCRRHDVEASSLRLGPGNFLSELPKVYKKREKKYRILADAVLNVSYQSRNKKGDLGKKLNKLLAIIGRLGLL